MNAKKGANSRDQVYFFREGRPTEAYFALIGRVPETIAAALRRPFKESDWYFNRALSHVMIAVEQIVFDVERERTRKRSYWAGAALKALGRWKKLTGTRGLAEMRARKLIPSRTTADQALLLGLSKAGSRKEIEKVIVKLVPYYKRSVEVIEWLDRVRTDGGAQRLRRSVLRNRHLPPELRALVLDNIAVLFPSVR
ncbi:MAG: hypothetical protein JNK40_09145 [Chromatiales bacterium]|nr:hypothetical protein [Chromatiales bacterium]